MSAAAPAHTGEGGRPGFVVTSRRGEPVIYYRDTRGEDGFDGWSNIVASSRRPEFGTVFATRRAAQSWGREFIGPREYRTVAVQSCASSPAIGGEKA